MSEDTTNAGVDLTDSARSKYQPKQVARAAALQYDPDVEKLPRVIASGKGAIAEQILNIAFANGIKVREDAELAEILTAIDVDSPIPLEAFAAVAEILAYVYQANAGMKQRTAGAGQ